MLYDKKLDFKGFITANIECFLKIKGPQDKKVFSSFISRNSAARNISHFNVIIINLTLRVYEMHTDFCSFHIPVYVEKCAVHVNV